MFCFHKHIPHTSLCTLSAFSHSLHHLLLSSLLFPPGHSAPNTWDWRRRRRCSSCSPQKRWSKVLSFLRREIILHYLVIVTFEQAAGLPPKHTLLPVIAYAMVAGCTCTHAISGYPGFNMSQKPSLQVNDSRSQKNRGWWEKWRVKVCSISAPRGRHGPGCFPSPLTHP